MYYVISVREWYSYILYMNFWNLLNFFSLFFWNGFAREGRYYRVGVRCEILAKYEWVGWL